MEKPHHGFANLFPNINSMHDLYALDEIRLSFSTESMLSSCLRKYEFTKALQMSNLNHKENTYAADAGTCLHIGLQKYAETGSREKAAFEMLLAYNFEALPDAKESRTVFACKSTLDAMCDEYDRQGFELAWFMDKNGEKKPGVELAFEILLPSMKIADKIVPVRYVGLIDLIAYSPKHECVVPIDAKTTTSTSHDLDAKYRFSSQMNPYGVVVAAAMPGMVEVDRIDVLYLHAFLDLLQPHAHTMSFVKTKLDLQDWYANVLQTVHRLRTNYELSWFPRNGNSCMTYNRRCQFFDNCHERDPKLLALTKRETQRFLKERYGDISVKPFVADITIDWREE